jgi:hypothetical protein
MEINFMSLKFFASRFNIPIKSLRWGIVNNSVRAVCSVLIKDKLLFIDIFEDVLVSRVTTKCKVRPCTLIENENSFIFANEENRITVKKSDIEAFYSNKVYSKGTDKYLLGAYAEIKPQDLF